MMPVTGDCLWLSLTSWDVGSMIARGSVFISCFLTVSPIRSYGLLSGRNNLPLSLYFSKSGDSKTYKMIVERYNIVLLSKHTMDISANTNRENTNTNIQ